MLIPRMIALMFLLSVNLWLLRRTTKMQMLPLLATPTLIKGILPDGLFFVDCAFGFNSQGLAFTLDSDPPAEDEIVAGGIGRNFISRDLLEATSMDDAMNRIKSSEVSVGHSYNLFETSTRRIVNVETASRKRISVYEVGNTPFFHANMYLHLPINQVQDENSISRQKRAAVLTKESKGDFLSLLEDMDDKKYPIYTTGKLKTSHIWIPCCTYTLDYHFFFLLFSGPLLHTLCTALIDLDKQTLSIIEWNPKKGDVSHVCSISPQKSP
ncbi:hypothetical protein GLYMA_08G020200v4 [Glycine max]|uniref:Peptidase C45 hydrolase domain-containing protein n=2 Tax=Glycine subgen. Soja TaxID=1462606 RepID=K7L4H7_SOYBN|nr:uncharacterized protein LOC100797354 isoform X1 [Glycine max]XP_040873825.1 uncharacterized protein LOC100797354 isoform X1 [Glycine max]KAH1049198.1 hypothetical protein GYH30_019979 [Glycine max]KRH41271.1 hypothetical protein GLYMA_08G020200v4 [Glycine max]RZB94834.1 hypothetical protein D0Y65_019363 [Glycine soja]